MPEQPRTKLPESIADIDFPQSEPQALLGLDRNETEERPVEDPDLDYDHTGHARVPQLDLSTRGKLVASLGSSLLLVLHSADDQSEAAEDDIDIEFFYELPHGEESVRVSLRTFLEQRLEKVLEAHAPLPPNIVLVMCNPKPTVLRSKLKVPTPAITIHYAEGDVLSWLDPDEDNQLTRYRLSADAWRQL